MNSWQQQDAQEYFSKILDEIDKEFSLAVARSNRTPGLKAIADIRKPSKNETKVKSTESNNHDIDKAEGPQLVRNPIEGLLAQRVGCTRCGYSDGLSMIPFNCLTLPLGKDWLYDIRDCLDEYTKLEDIEGVECAKCTLLQSQTQMQKFLNQMPVSSDNESLRLTIQSRLKAVGNALEEDDFAENTLIKKCKIPPKNQVTTTKSRQAVIARPPKSLAIHINRSIFNEITGELRKNFAAVKFPTTLDLAPWCLGSNASMTEEPQMTEQWLLNPALSMICGSGANVSCSTHLYELKAVVTHYGRHENGHYICYRKFTPALESNGDSPLKKEQWWRISDDDVTTVTEEVVLDQGGVFMLFYDQIENLRPSPVSNASSITTSSKDHVDSEINLRAFNEAVSVPLPEGEESDFATSSDDDSNSSAPSVREESVATSVNGSEPETMSKSGECANEDLLHVADSSTGGTSS
jgi:ubiquitin carboxyl-terminal hydrolase 1